jgi:hypothetical protein
LVIMVKRTVFILQVSLGAATASPGRAPDAQGR